MRKLGCLLVSLLVIAVLLGGSSPVHAAGDVIIRLAHVLPESHASHIALVEVFKKQIEEGTNGKVTVELYPNGQLGADRQAIEAVSLGTLEMTMATGALLPSYDGKFAVLDLPFIFSSHEAARNALDGELGEALNKLFEPHHMYNLAWCEGGFRNITNSRQPVYGPSDVKGMKIRTMENPYHVAAFKSYGANPTPMAFSELYTALQQKTVDAQENPVSIIHAAKFYEVQKYCSLTGHVYGTVPIYVNKEFFDSLPDEYKDVISKAAQATKDRQRNEAYSQDTGYIEELKASGMEVNDLTSEQKAEFRKAAQPVYDEYVKKFGTELVDLALKYNQ